MTKKELVAKYFRRCLEPIAKEYYPEFYNAKMAGLCVIASFSLHSLFKELGINSRFVIGTFYSNNDVFGTIDHSFVVSDNLIIDITSDQFGEQPITITSINDKRYSVLTTNNSAIKNLNNWPEEQKPTKIIVDKLLDNFEKNFLV